MAVPIIYVIIGFSYLLLLFAFWIKDFTFAMLSCLTLFALSVYTFINGIGTWANTELIVIMFSAITFGIAAYVSITSVLEIINENY